MTRSLRLAFLAASLVLVASLVPSAARADEETKPRTWLVAGGASVFGLAYGASVVTGLSGANVTDVDRSAFGWMVVPVAGPFVTAASGDLRRDEKLTIPALGVAQIVGVSAAVAGFVFPTRSTVVVPGGPAGAAGATVVGTF